MRINEQQHHKLQSPLFAIVRTIFFELFSFGFTLCLIPCSVCIRGALIIVIKFDSVTELNMAAIIRYHLLVFNFKWILFGVLPFVLHLLRDPMLISLLFPILLPILPHQVRQQFSCSVIHSTAVLIHFSDSFNSKNIHRKQHTILC